MLLLRAAWESWLYLKVAWVKLNDSGYILKICMSGTRIWSRMTIHSLLFNHGSVLFKNSLSHCTFYCSRAPYKAKWETWVLLISAKTVLNQMRVRRGLSVYGWEQRFGYQTTWLQLHSITYSLCLLRLSLCSLEQGYVICKMLY